ncbi:hypothetical protein D3C76_1032540 [compost metagenome]
MAQRAVIALGVPLVLQLTRQFLHVLGDFHRRQALVEQVQGAVVEEGIHVALVGDQRAHLFSAPGRPVVLAEEHFGLVAVTRQAGVQVL